MNESIGREDLLAMTTEIVSAYLSNNTLQAAEIPAVIEQVYKTVANLNTETSVTADRPQPAVP
ncbi:MAG: MucR family transcriptional regulator, partial [Alphaproteobacteria bacterium]|nr:MucR family transcriptional regulator [Alphaproteobacteria bacterium]